MLYWSTILLEMNVRSRPASVAQGERRLAEGQCVNLLLWRSHTLLWALWFFRTLHLWCLWHPVPVLQQPAGAHAVPRWWVHNRKRMLSLAGNQRESVNTPSVAAMHVSVCLIVAHKDDLWNCLLFLIRGPTLLGCCRSGSEATEGRFLVYRTIFGALLTQPLVYIYRTNNQQIKFYCDIFVIFIKYVAYPSVIAHYIVQVF